MEGGGEDGFEVGREEEEKEEEKTEKPITAQMRRKFSTQNPWAATYHDDITAEVPLYPGNATTSAAAPHRRLVTRRHHHRSFTAYRDRDNTIVSHIRPAAVTPGLRGTLLGSNCQGECQEDITLTATTL